MKYTSELHERVRQNLRMFDYPRFDNGDIDALLDEIEHLNAELARLTAELAELRERFDVTDDLLNQATVTIGAVIACCTYNSNEDAKIGIYGISPDAFTRIDQFITNYNRAVSAGKVSVDVKPVKRDLSDAEIEELGAAEAEKRGEK